MRIRRSFERDGTVRPRALNTLTALPQHVLNHAGHGKRHPVSVYGQSLRVIGEQWLRVFDRLDIVYSEYHWERGTSKYAELLHEYHGLLSRLHEHADACLSVLRSLCPVGEKPKKLDFQFLEQVKPAGWKSFRDSTRTYQKERLGAIVNTLKHDQGTLCMLYFYSALEFRPGYFLQDVLADGSLIRPGACMTEIVRVFRSLTICYCTCGGSIERVTFLLRPRWSALQPSTTSSLRRALSRTRTTRSGGRTAKMRSNQT